MVTDRFSVFFHKRGGENHERFRQCSSGHSSEGSAHGGLPVWADSPRIAGWGIDPGCHRFGTGDWKASARSSPMQAWRARN